MTNNLKSVQPLPIEDEATDAMPTPSASATPTPYANGSRVSNKFDLIGATISDATVLAVQTEQQVRQWLAESVDLHKLGAERASEAAAIDARVASALYQARVSGAFSAERVTGLLGDQFGYKVVKSTGKPGKTPDGEGEAIRKRVVRAYQAHETLNGREGGAFFEGMTPDTADDKGNTLASVVDKMNEGKLSVWTAYNLFGDIKKEAADATIQPAFNVKRIAAITADLSGEGAVANFIDNEPLQLAYAELLKVVRTVGEAISLLEADA